MKRLHTLLCFLAVCVLLAAPVTSFAATAVEPDIPSESVESPPDGQTPAGEEMTPEDETAPPEEDREGMISAVLAELRSGWDLYVVPMIASVSSSAFVFTIAGFVLNVVSKKRNQKQSETIRGISALLSGEQGLAEKIRTLGSALVELSERHQATAAEVKAIRETEATLGRAVEQIDAAIARLGEQNDKQLTLMDLAWTNAEGLNTDTRQTMKAILCRPETEKTSEEVADDDDAG